MNPTKHHPTIDVDTDPEVIDAALADVVETITGQMAAHWHCDATYDDPSRAWLKGHLGTEPDDGQLDAYVATYHALMGEAIRVADAMPPPADDDHDSDPDWDSRVIDAMVLSAEGGVR